MFHSFIENVYNELLLLIEFHVASILSCGEVFIHKIHNDIKEIYHINYLNLLTPLYPTYLIHNNKTLFISYNDGSIHGYNISLNNKQEIIQFPELNEYILFIFILFVFIYFIYFIF